MMRTFVGMIKNNFSNLFSIIGILLTIYFSVFYIPNYTEEIIYKRIENVNKELISSIQELIYNNQDISINNIETLIKGKELRDNIEYPYSVEELLIQVQETFMSNNFIPLEDRKVFFDKTDKIRKEIVHIQTSQLEGNKTINLLGLIVSILGVAVSTIGGISLFQSIKMQKETEINKEVDNRKDDFTNIVMKAISFEENVYDKLKSIFGEKSIKKADQENSGVDFIFQREDKKILIEVKYSERGILNSQSIMKIASIAKREKLPVIIITNYDINDSILNRINKINTEFNEPILKIISIKNINKIENIISEVL